MGPITETTTTAGSIPDEGEHLPLTMRAVQQHRYGGSDNLAVESIPRPSPGAGEVLIEVHAAGVDRGTEHLMHGDPYLIRLMGFGLRRPKQSTPGLDVAGVVVEVGTGVSRFAAGDPVFGIARGSLAEYALAEEGKLAPLPDGVGVEDAAVSTVSGITALQALTDVGGVEAGQQVLVVGASGGVGTFAVQLAVAHDAVVTGVAGTDNLELVRALGASRVIDHRTTDLSSLEDRYDLILDIGGRNRVRVLRKLLRPRGTLVMIGGEGGNRITGGIGRQVRAACRSPFVSQRLRMFLSTEAHSFVERLGVFLASGDVVPAIRGRYSLDEVGAALDSLSAGRGGGKALIVVRSSDTDAG